MPIDPIIDPVQRIVFARAWGILTDLEAFAYQREVWSQPELAGYHELVDMSEVEQIVLPSSARVLELANLASHMDRDSPRARMAIVASTPLAFGLGRMYQVYRGANNMGTKEVKVFRQRDAAMNWLLSGRTTTEMETPS